MKTISWFSAGVSSFIAAWLVRDTLDEMIYIDIEDQHPDSKRFLSDCEKVLRMGAYKKGVTVLMSPLRSVSGACRAAAAIKFPQGAPCTDRLKKRVRKEWERAQKGELTYVWGLDCDEKHRADRIVQAMPKQHHLFPLIENGCTKADAHGMAKEMGIKRPAMYDLGYNNNNCIGCVKGGMGYWNKIRRDFPAVFEERAKLERLIGASCLKECYLDELDPERGRDTKMVLEDCGIMCELLVPEAPDFLN
jgi:hypothetical protein